MRPWLSNTRLALYILFCGILYSTSRTSDAIARDDPFLTKLIGSWKGSGELFGVEARFAMTWEWVLDGKFARLTFQNKFLKARAYYRATGAGEYEGTWFDSRGMVLPLKARIEDEALVTHWGSPETEQGRTRYRPLGQGRMGVEDFVFKDNAWSSFGRANYAKAEDPTPVVIDQQEAFNAKDVDAMVANSDENLIWFSVMGDSLVVEAAGQSALREAMAGYFNAIPSARSEIEEAMVSGSHVAVRERAFWQSKTGERSQVSLGVYQVREGKIHRVWYFPAER